MSAYRVYLDGTLLHDTPSGLTEFDVQIIREDGFGGSDQILRDKTDTQLSFYGDGYALLCSKKKANICSSVTIEIQFLCNNIWESLFNGIIPISMIEFDITRCIAKTQVRDNSFTGLIKDYLKTEIPLYNTKTKNCEALELIDKPIMFGSTAVTSFDVLDVFKYLIWFITDNQVDVVSTYLTTNKIAITTGFNMHNTGGTLEKLYPKIMFSKLFDEVRKKTRIYEIIEYSGSIPYLRIEEEGYAYDNTEVYSFSEVPWGVIEKLDTSRIFNSIECGSDKTDLQDASTGGFNDPYPSNVNDYQPTDIQQSWDKKVYTSCGQCTAENISEQNKLDLVSSYIIDSDVFKEALAAVPTDNASQYAHDDDIFMFEYSNVAGVDTATMTLDTATGKYIYNAGFRNARVITNWLGYTPQCITLVNSTGNYFLVQRTSAQQSYPPGDTEYDNSIFPVGTTEIFDNGNNVVGFKFTCPDTGNYIFRQSTDIKYKGGTAGIINDTQPTYTPYYLKFDVASSTYSTILGLAVTPADPLVLEHLSFESSAITLNAGDIIYAGLRINQFGTTDPFFDFYYLYNTKWELIKDVASCNTTTDVTNSLPNLIEFESKLCYSDLKTIRGNKRGYVRIGLNKYWIKNITWKERNVTKFMLIGADTLCGCD